MNSLALTKPCGGAALGWEAGCEGGSEVGPPAGSYSGPAQGRPVPRLPPENVQTAPTSAVPAGRPENLQQKFPRSSYNQEGVLILSYPGMGRTPTFVPYEVVRE